MLEENKKSPVLLILVGVILVLLALVAFFLWRSSSSNNNNNANNTTPTPTATSTPTPSVTTTPTDVEPTTTTTPSTSATPTSSVAPTGPQKVNVYYSQAANPTNASAPDSYKSFTYYVYRTFTSSRGDIENYVMEQMIAGPSQADKDTYYWFTPIALSGDSNCSGKDFQVTMDKTANKATVQFCKTVQTAGVGDDARVTAVVKAGLGQFLSTDTSMPAKKVVILTKDNHCFGDASGQDTCKN